MLNWHWKKARAWDNFSNQQINLQTHFGKQYEDGIEISGGQWQKIAIARAFLNDDHAHLRSWMNQPLQLIRAVSLKFINILPS